MRRPRGSNALRAIDVLAALASDFDFRIDSEDFVLYETARAIEEERASLEDIEFQTLIDAGVREHAASNLAVRAELAGLYRRARPTLEPDVRETAGRVIDAIENLESDLCDTAVVVRSYTRYLFKRLAEPSADNVDNAETLDNLARGQIAQWQSGGLVTEQLTEQFIEQFIGGLTALGRAAAPAAADLLFETPNDLGAATIAVRVLSRIASPVSARVLTHAVSEPMLDETVEQLAFDALGRLWPLARPYILLVLQRHEHEDLPVRWFQLLAESQAAEAVDLTLDEIVRHADSPAFQEDLLTILDFLPVAGDPATTLKILERLNDPNTPTAAAPLLEGFLKSWRDPAPAQDAARPWGRRVHLAAIHSRYRAAAALADEGKAKEALVVLNEILESEPGYPFATMLKAQL